MNQIGKKFKSYGIMEITTFISIIAIITTLTVIILSFVVTIIATTDMQAMYYMAIYMNFVKSIIIFIIFIISIQITLTSISVINHAFFVKDKKKHRILLVGIDYYNFLTGKQMHCIKILKVQILKIANTIL